MKSKINSNKFLVAFFTYCFLACIFMYEIHAQAPEIKVDFQENTKFENLVSKNISSFFESINSAFENKRNPNFKTDVITKSASETVLMMWEMSPFKCVKPKLVERLIIKPQGGFEVRNIPVFMLEASAEEQNQELVIVINKFGLVDNIYVSVETNRYNQLIEQGASVQEFRRRQIILDFIENFRTAYNRKDLKYIESVYSEDALIITGKVVEKSTPDASNQLLPIKTVQYQKQTKKEYMNKLRQIMEANTYINVKFDSVQIKRHDKYPNIYGVDMMQAWNTSKYSDEGFLLLAIDFSEDDKPLIHVRTWQPARIGNKSLSEAEKFKLSDFKMN